MSTPAPRDDRHGTATSGPTSTARDVATGRRRDGAGARPIAGGTDLVVGARHGKAPLPAGPRRDPPDPRAGDARAAGRRRPAPRGARHPRDDRGPPGGARGRTGLADACAIVGSHATRANGTLGGNVMNASPAMDTGAPLLCHGGVAVLVGPAGSAGSPWRSCGPAPAGRRPRPTSCSSPSSCPRRRRPALGQRVRAAAVPPPDGDRDRRGRCRRDPRRRRHGHRRADRDHRARAGDPPGRRRPRRPWSGTDGGAARSRAAGPRPPPPPGRSRTSAARPTTAGRWPPS